MDNSDVKVSTGKGVGGVYGSKSEAEEMKLYLENLKLMAELTANDDEIEIKAGSGTVKVKVNTLIPKESEFERVRKVVISNLNKLGDADLRTYQAKYEADGIFELSSKIANFMLDQNRKQSELTQLKKWIP